MLDIFSMAGNYDQRKVANTKITGGQIDTAMVTESTKPYETGIKHTEYNGGDWVIVELYDTKDEAKAGHKRWCQAMANPPEYLTDVNECGWEQVASMLGASQCGRKYRQVSQST